MSSDVSGERNRTDRKVRYRSLYGNMPIPHTNMRIMCPCQISHLRQKTEPLKT